MTGRSRTSWPQHFPRRECAFTESRQTEFARRTFTRARAVGSLLAMGIAVALGACGSDDVFVPPSTVVPSAGTLVVDWTIEGAKDPGACTQFAAGSLQVSVGTADGRDAGTYAQTCSAFSTSIALAPGTYVANAQLVDDAGRARTTVVAIQTFTIYGNDQLVIPIDFPNNSFY